MSVILTKDQILRTKLPYKDIEVPEYGGSVRIQVMTLKRRQQFIQAIVDAQAATKDHEADPANNPAPALGGTDEAIIGLIFAIVDGNGDLVFSLDDANEITKLSSTTISHLYLEFINLNRFGEMGDLQLEKKGSKQTGNGASSSVSPATSKRRSKS